MFLFLGLVKAWTESGKPAIPAHGSIDELFTPSIYRSLYKTGFQFHGRAAKVTTAARMGWKIWFGEFWPTWRTQLSLWWSGGLRTERSRGADTRHTHPCCLAHSSGRGPSLCPRSYKQKTGKERETLTFCCYSATSALGLHFQHGAVRADTLVLTNLSFTAVNLPDLVSKVVYGGHSSSESLTLAITPLFVAVAAPLLAHIQSFCPTSPTSCLTWCSEQIKSSL